MPPVEQPDEPYRKLTPSGLESEQAGSLLPTRDIPRLVEPVIETGETLVVSSGAWTDSAPGSTSPEAVTKVVPGDAGASDQRCFSPGELVAGRFHIVRFIAEGGMGELYEALDTKLQEQVALKTVRPQLARSSRVLDRFRREIRLARRVTHPNVCRLHDAFETTDGALFLAMELLQGETLLERLRRTGRMSQEEALLVARQMAAGLGAAHEVGVVHRDFKGGNVILVSSKGKTRAVVTDFGLARSILVDEGPDASLLTGAGLVLGTPATMAPEQVRGEEATATADLYALGVVLYEMVTGTLPFTGKTSLEIATKRLHQAPAPPRSLVPELDAKLEAVILRCLEREPRDRFASAAELMAALEGDTPVLPRPSAPPRRSVAVLGLRNLSGRADAAWLSTAISEMLATELAAGEVLRIVPTESVARMRLELGLVEADSFGHDSLVRIRENIGADLVVIGAYLLLGGSGPMGTGRMRLDLRLQDALIGETVAAIREEGTEQDLFDLVARLGARLRERLGAGDLSAAEREQVQASMPKHPEAARAYSEGLARLRLEDALGAMQRLSRAVELAPEHPMVHSALAEVWLRLGYEKRAVESAQLAYDRSADLPREERLLVEGRYHQARGDRRKTIEAYQALFTFFPDHIEYGLRLATAQFSSGRIGEVLETLARLRQIPPPAGQDPRLDLWEALTAQANGDFSASRTFAKRAAEKARAVGARLILAEAHMLEGSSILSLEGPGAALASFEEARRIFAEAGDRSREAFALMRYAPTVLLRGDVSAARHAYEAALHIHRETGSRVGQLSALYGLGCLRLLEGELPAAKTLHTEALEIALEMQGKLTVATARWGLGEVLVVQGDLSSAESNLSEALARCEAGTAKVPKAWILNWLGEVSLGRGDLAAARERFERALNLHREIREKRGVGNDLEGLARTLLAQADLRGARDRFEESRRLLRETGNSMDLALPLLGLGQLVQAEGDLHAARALYDEALASRSKEADRMRGPILMALSVLDIEEGRAKEAEGTVRSLLPLLRRQERHDEEAGAISVLMLALSEQGKHDEARELLERSLPRLDMTQRLDTRISRELAAARVRMVSGRPEDADLARTSLEPWLARAASAGLVLQHFDLRLALGRLDLATRRSEAGRASLEALRRDADALGLGLIARKAARDLGAT